MSPTVASILMLSLLLVLPLPAAEAGEITDLFALVRNTLKYWRRVYQTYEEEVTLGYCWAEYLLRRGHDVRNASEFVDPTPLENDSFGKEQWNQWIFAVQGHGARAKRSYPRVSQTCGINEFSSEEKDDTKPVRKTTLLDRKNLQRQRRPRNSSFQSAGEFPSDRHGCNFAKEGGISENIVDFRRNSNPIEANESRAKRELNRETSTDQVREYDPAKYERFLRNLARRGERSSEIPSPTNIGEISKIAPDASASSTRPSGSNKTKFKLNELCSSHGSRNPAVDETGDAFPRDTQDDYSPLASKRLVETPGLGSSNVEKLSNSWKGIPGELREVKVSSSGQRIGESRSMSCRQTVWPPIVADVERLSSSSKGFVNTRADARRKLLFFGSRFRVGRTTSRNSRSIKHEPVVEGVSKFRASSSHVLQKSPLSTDNNGRTRKGANNSKQSSLFVGDHGSRSTAVEARELAAAHQVLFHFQRVITGFLTTLGFFVNVGRQLMDYVDSNSALACTKDYILGKAVHWIDS
ncbi:hypothetical protein WN51_14307 [Melipona quadrifasciata]|uniref:Uncharacterized protein n=1 Tax=Melipona quadrifasciata TaxID=166423 RepID=A0A0M9A113_9HYME|nr:hypothetical protein WN51_14307 [Melipona quadrifasciata]